MVKNRCIADSAVTYVLKKGQFLGVHREVNSSIGSLSVSLECSVCCYDYKRSLLQKKRNSLLPKALQNAKQQTTIR